MSITRAEHRTDYAFIGWPVLQLVLGLLAAWAILAAVPVAAAQSCPGFPARGVEIIDQVWNPTQANGDDDARRALTRAIVEQLVYEFPSDGWVWKSADKNRPPSKDGLARQVGGTLCAWDWQNGSTRRRSVQVDQVGEDITGQYPIVVAGVNHLRAPTPGPGGPAVPSDSPAVLTRLEALEQAVQAIAARLPALEQAMAGARGVEAERLDAFAAKLDVLAASTADRLAELGGRIPVGCRSAVNLGFGKVPTSCGFEFGQR